MINYLWENLFRPDKQQRTIRSSLKENMLFTNLSSRELAFIEEIVTVRPYSAGEIVFKQGEVGSGMYIIAQGQIDIFTYDAATTKNHQTKEVSRDASKDVSRDFARDVSRDVLVTRLETGDFFGDLALVEENGRRTATAACAEDCILIGFFKPDLDAIIDRDPGTGVKVLRRLSEVLGRRLKETTDKISLYKSEIKRLQAAKDN